MKPSESIEAENARDAYRTHFRTDRAAARHPMSSNGHRVLDVDFAHVTALIDAHRHNAYGNGARAVYDLDTLLRAAAVIRDAYPDEHLVIAFSTDDHWPCVLRPKVGQYGVAVAPIIPSDENDEEAQSGIMPPTNEATSPGAV